MKRYAMRRIAALIILSMLCTVALPAAAEDKKETVYAFADAEGTVNSVTVSERLFNYEKRDEITDVSTLQDIENVGGDQTYSRVTDDVILWQADGGEIAYEGTSDAPLPVGVRFSYKLDGVSITPGELAGKSGHLEITVDYQSLLSQEVTVNGKKENMPVPFVMVTVVRLDEETASNIQVTNGKFVTAGSLRGAVCYGLPGVSEALHLSDYDEIDLDIPTSSIIEADVVDFSSEGAYTFATSYVADVVKEEDKLDLDLDSLTADLDDAMGQLLDGAGDLSDGAEQLADGAAQLADGTGVLKDGARTLAGGTADLEDGARQLADGAAALEDGVAQVDGGAGELADGAGQLADGTAELADGARQLADGTGALRSGADVLADGAEEIGRASV